MAANETDVIMNMIDSIFQNIGYRRWVEGIRCLQNQQIYFEICNIVFHSSSIELIKINESNLSSGDKIQAIINLVSRIINMDLSHISGKMIAQGNISHLKNLLELFKHLSYYILVNSQGNAPSSVRSAPQADSQEEHEQLDNLNHTVQATTHQFGYTDTDDERILDARHEQIQHSDHKRRNSKSNRHKDSQKIVHPDGYGEEILDPRGDKEDGKSKKKASNEKKSESQPSSARQKQNKQQSILHRKSIASSRKDTERRKTQPTDQQFELAELNSQIKVSYCKRMYQTIEALEQRKIKDTQDDYIQREQKLIDQAARDQKRIKRDHQKLCRKLKENRKLLDYVVEKLYVNPPSFGQQLKKMLKTSARQDRKKRIYELEVTKQGIMQIVESSDEIERLQRQVAQLYQR